MGALLAILADPVILAAGGIGAWIGSQLDDKIDGGAPVPAQQTQSQLPSVNKIIVYSAVAIGLYWGLNKSGLLKAFK